MQGVGDVGRQHKFALYQGGNQHHHYHRRQHPQILAFYAGQENQWHKRQHCRGRAGQHRGCHHRCSIHRRLQRWLTPLRLPENTLRNDYGVIHQHAQHQNNAGNTQLIDRDIERGHEHEGQHHRGGNTDHHPHGKAEGKECQQGHKHQQHSQQRITGEHFQHIARIAGGIVKHFQGNPRWHQGLLLFQEFAKFGRHGDTVRLGSLLYQQTDTGLAIGQWLGHPIFVVDNHIGDIPHPGKIVAPGGPHNDFGHILGVLKLPHRHHIALGGSGIQRATGIAHIARGNRPGNFCSIYPQLLKTLGVEQNAYFLAAIAKPV